MIYYFSIPKEPVKEAFVDCVTDLCGNAIHYVRDKNSLREIKESGGRRIDITSRNGRIEIMRLIYSYRDSRLLVKYEYDQSGNLITVYDALNAPYRFRYQNNLEGHTTTYCYDPLGRCISKETDGIIMRFYWDGDALLGDIKLEQSVCTSRREWIYYPDSFEPLAMLQDQSLYLYHNDPNGCPTRLLDSDGKVVWAARHDALGKIESLPVNKVDNPLRMQGQYFDEETGLYYNRYRYFDPTICAFISQDPLGLEAGENVYAYAPNVWGWADPFGLKCIANKIAGTAREKKVGRRLEKKFGKGNVLRERYLRDANGKIVRDSNGKARRLDFVIKGKDGKGTAVEVTSKTADKTAQLLKENEIRQMGGTFVRDSKTKQLTEVRDVSRVIRLK